MPGRFTKRLLVVTLLLTLHACTQQEARRPVNTSVSSRVEDSVSKNRAQLAYETEVLENWVARQNMSYTQTSYGVWYSHAQSDVAQIFIDSTSLPTLYLNMLRLDGTPYYEPTRIENPLTNQYVPSGILQVMKEIPVGLEATVAMPSALAFGATGDGELIPPNAPLVARIFITLNSQKNNP